MVSSPPSLDPSPKPRTLTEPPIILIVVVMVALAVGVRLMAADAPTNKSAATATEQTSTTVAQASTAAPLATTQSAAATSPAPASSSAFGYQPLWPFATLGQAQDWAQQYAAGGHQPWRLDAQQVALAFTRNFLGFTNIDSVVGERDAPGQAWVMVGFANPRGAMVESAQLHLVRMGTGEFAPWEVVGSEDDTLTLTTPVYGAPVSTPLRAAGRIAGVDESLTVQVLALTDPRVVGVVAGVSAGGEMSPWSVTVPFTGGAGQTLTVVVSTGGHIAQVERFAVTGVRS